MQEPTDNNEIEEKDPEQDEAELYHNLRMEIVKAQLCV